MHPPPTLDLAGNRVLAGVEKRDQCAYTLTDTCADTRTQTSKENFWKTWQRMQVFLFIDLLFILTALHFNSSSALFMNLYEIILFSLLLSPQGWLKPMRWFSPSFFYNLLPETAFSIDLICVVLKYV